MEKSQAIQSAKVTQTHSFHSSDSTGRIGHKFHVLRKDSYIHEALSYILNRRVLLRGWKKTQMRRTYVPRILP